MEYNPQPPVVQWAQYYASQGLIVVPVKPQGKRPSMGDLWQANLDNTRNISYLNINSNVGLMLGPHSRNLCDIDLDHPNTVLAAPYFLPSTATFGRTSAPSSHWEYYLTFVNADLAVAKWQDKISVKGMGCLAEFRYNAQKGIQTVVPPSIHQDTQELISWTDVNSADPLSGIATVDASYLKRQYLKTVAMGILMSVIEDGWKHDATVYISGILKHLAWPVEEAEHFILALCQLCDMADVEDRLKCLYDSYTNETDKHIGGFNELARILNQSSIDGDMVVRGLRNTLMPTGCGDAAPQTPADVFSKLTPASQQMLNSKGVSAGQQASEPTPPFDLQYNNSVANAPPHGMLGVNTSQTESGYELTAEEGIPRFSSAWTESENTLSNENYLIQNLIPKCEVGFLFGESGTFKSYMMLDMVLSMMWKDKWAGQLIDPLCGDVLWVAGEGKKSMNNRIKTWKQENWSQENVQKGEMLYYNHRLDIYVDPRKDHTNGNSMDRLTTALKETPSINMVVLDTWSSLFSGEENKNSDVATTIREMNLLAELYQVTFLIVHHKDKAGNVYRGAGALVANSDFNFDLSKEYKLGEGEKITADTPHTGRVIFESKQQRSCESNIKLHFRPNIVPLLGVVDNFGSQVKNLVMNYEDQNKVAKVFKKDAAKKNVGIDCLKPVQRDSFNDIYTVMRETPGAGTNGVKLQDLFDAVVKHKAANKQKMSNRIDNFCTKVDHLVASKCLIKTRRGHEEWIQIGADRYIIPGYTDTSSVLANNEGFHEDVGAVFSVIPAPTNRPLSDEQRFGLPDDYEGGSVAEPVFKNGNASPESVFSVIPIPEPNGQKPYNTQYDNSVLD